MFTLQEHPCQGEFFAIVVRLHSQKSEVIMGIRGIAKRVSWIDVLVITVVIIIAASMVTLICYLLGLGIFAETQAVTPSQQVTTSVAQTTTTLDATAVAAAEEAQRQADLALLRTVAAELDAKYGGELTSNGNGVKPGSDYEPGMPLGKLEIPSIGVDEVLYQGRTDSVKNDPILALGPNLLPETAIPLTQGKVRYGSNSVLAGHHSQDTAPFARLMELVPGDEIIVKIMVPLHQFYAVHYTVLEARDYDAWAVMDVFEAGEDRLYIGTCHNSYDIIYTVTAELTSWELLNE